MASDQSNFVQSSSEKGTTDGAAVLLFGASGTIGTATYKVLLERGFDVVCPVRAHIDTIASSHSVICDLSDTASLKDVFGDKPISAVVSCIASRSGTKEDAWMVDYKINSSILKLAQEFGVRTFVLLSAICVQKPKLEFQFAKLAFEEELASSGVTFSIVRPTAFFKSLSGQIQRVREGKPYLLFGDGELTACKPIGDQDLANYLVDCIETKSLHNKVLPIGGPGPVITPLEQGKQLFDLLGMRPSFRRIPVSIMSAIVAALSICGCVSKRAKKAAALAAIGHYYATESMLLFDPETNRYDADLTPSYGSQTLRDHYSRIVRGDIDNERVDAVVF